MRTMMTCSLLLASVGLLAGAAEDSRPPGYRGTPFKDARHDGTPQAIPGRVRCAPYDRHHWNKQVNLAKVTLPKGVSVRTVKVLTEGQMNFESFEFTPE